MLHCDWFTLTRRIPAWHGRLKNSYVATWELSNSLTRRLGACRIVDGDTICRSSRPSLNLARLVLDDLSSFNATEIPSIVLEGCRVAIERSIDHGTASRLAASLVALLVISALICFASLGVAAMSGSIFSRASLIITGLDVLVIFASICVYIAMINIEGGGYLGGVDASEYSDEYMLGLALWFLLAMLAARLISNPVLVLIGIFIILPIILAVFFALIRVRGIWRIVRIASDSSYGPLEGR